MTDAPFTETHRATLLDMREHFIPVRQSVAITAALAEIDRLTAIQNDLSEKLDRMRLKLDACLE